MQRIRRSLTGFADSERMIQICNIEALEQIRRAAPDYDPDTLVAYAMSDLLSSGLTLTATGGRLPQPAALVWNCVQLHRGAGL